ncbi:MAG: SctK family type III secretion system sorting platform protein [Pseudomonadota bacterium]
MNATARHAWMAHPLAGMLLRFNLEPAWLFHPSRQAEWQPEGAQALPAAGSLARHVSGALLRRLGLARVERLDDPALPLFMAPAPLFERLTLCCGLVVLGPSLRRVIARAEVLALQAQLGEDGLRFARAAARLWDAAGPVSMEPAANGVYEQALRSGAALLWLAAASAAEPVAQRALLRLPVDAQDAVIDLPHPLERPANALALARSVLDELEPAWLSSFPAPR